MMSRALVALVLGLVLLPALPAAAVQSAAPTPAVPEQKATEQKSTESLAKLPVRVYTNEDLLNAKGTVTILAATPEGETQPGEPEATETPGAPPAGPEGAEDARAAAERDREQLRADLQAKIDEQVARIAEIRKRIDEAQLELNDLSNYTFGGRRAELTQLIDTSQAQIAQAEQTIADLAEQARRQGLRITRP